MDLEEDWHIRCVCHIMNRAVTDCAKLITKEVSKVRTTLKVVRNCARMRLEFKKIQVRLGIADAKIVDVPSLDVETRWNSLFLMIDACYEVKDVFQALCNMEEFQEKLQDQLTTAELRELNAEKEVLQPAYELTTQASGQYATLSMEPLIFESLIKHCDEFIRQSMTTKIEVLVAAEAAEVMKAKLKKYECYLTCELSRLALALDPAIPNTSTEVEAMKVLIRETLVREYGMTVQHAPTQSQRGLLAAARGARAPRSLNIISDEVDDYFDFTRMGDESCNDAIEWSTIGIKRFPAMAALVRDTLMCMGSSVPSESSFSDSGHFVSADRTKLNDANIGMMMKLRSWNRLLQKVK
jgi:hypothetical protein